MITLKKIRYKNILSAGNSPTEIDFTAAKMTIVSGKNGAGKSTGVLEAVAFGLYGKPFRKINKSQLINSTNKKELLVEIEFDTPAHSYLVKRGIKPNIFEIYKDGQLINQESSVTEYQDVLEKQILKINFKAFTQIVVLGSATYVPFMELPAAQRREIIEDLLDLEIFSKMNESLKERISENKETLRDAEIALDRAAAELNTIRAVNQQISKSRLDTSESIKAKIADAIGVYDEEIERRNSLRSQVASLEEDLDKVENPYDEIGKLKTSASIIASEIKKYEADEVFFREHEHCSVCKQDISGDHKKYIFAGIESKKDKKKSELAVLVDLLTEKQKVTMEREEKMKAIRPLKDSLIRCEGKISELKRLLQTLKDEYQKSETSSKAKSEFRDETEAKENLRKAEEHYDKLKKQKDLYAISQTHLKDTGIKASFVSKYIPAMNSLINGYLETFGLPVNFTLNENFEERILSRNMDDFTYSSFSEGEKLRINLSIMMAWRDISKCRNSMSTNVLIMDEILDGAADIEAVETLLGIIRNMENDNNIFVISHRGQEFGEKFDRHLRYEKQGGFSVMSIEEQ